jgi:hypothetical protein
MNKGLAIVNMLIYVVIFSILSGTILSLLSSSTRTLERDIRRTRGFYASQAATVMALDRMRQGSAFPGGNINLPWSHDMFGNIVAYKQVMLTNAPGAGVAGTMRVDSMCDYTINW